MSKPSIFAPRRRRRGENETDHDESDSASFSTSDWWSNKGRYFSRRFSSKIATSDLPLELDAIGFNSFWAYFWIILFCVAPFCYIYIGLIVLRELCLAFGSFDQSLQYYLPWIHNIAKTLYSRSSRTMEAWCLLEAIFFLLLKLKIAYLQTRDPLEASLSAAPLLDQKERRQMWHYIVECEMKDPISFLRGWFFDVELDQMSRHDIFDFVCWSMFDGRSPEHLTLEECMDLEDFVQELEWIISLQLYGKDDDATKKKHQTNVESDVQDETDDDQSVQNYDCGDTTSASHCARTDDTAVPPHTMTPSKNSHDFQQNRTNQGSEQALPSSPSKYQNINVASPLRRRWNMSSGRSTPETLSSIESSDEPPTTFEHSDDPSDMPLPDEDANLGSWAGRHHPRPQKIFRFAIDHAKERNESGFAASMYDSFKNRFDQFQRMVEHADFHPFQDFVRFMEETAIEVQKAEEAAFHRAQTMYTNLMGAGERDEHGENATNPDAFSRQQLWSSVSSQLKGTRLKLQERFETAKFWSAQRQTLLEQLRGNRAMLSRMREMSYAVPAKQMAALMRNITEGHNALENTERRAKEAFWNATSILYDNTLGQTSMARHIVSTIQQRAPGMSLSQEPTRYAKYSSDPLLGIATYPLGLHALVLGSSEISLRIMLRNRGFQRRCVGPVSYYYHAGKVNTKPTDSNVSGATKGANGSTGYKSPYFQQPGKRRNEKVPLVFVHGIGIGLIIYMPLIDHLLETGRPMLLPEIPYVSGFRPWQGPNSVLSPAVVASTMTAMLAIHGFTKGAFIGHSYGTTWLSYMCKYAKNAVAALLFLDPICFCLHYSRLTKNFVYHRPDPGTSSFMVRTDIIVNWTIQRSFPWAWIILFIEHMKDIPCTIFLSDEDALVPAEKIEQYLTDKGTPICDFDENSDGSFFYENAKRSDLNACVFRGHYHGGWAEQPTICVPVIAQACNALCEKVERRMTWKRME